MGEETMRMFDEIGCLMTRGDIDWSLENFPTR